MASDDTIVTNQPLGGLKQHTRKSGKQYFTISVRAEPLVHDIDPMRLGKGPSEAIAAFFRQRLGEIGDLAAAATLDMRKRATRALGRGAGWAARAYAGGQLGSMPPDQSPRIGFASGRFVKSIVARATKDGEWLVNFAANRLNPSIIGDAGVARVWSTFLAHVPELGDAGLLSTVLPIRRALKSAHESIAKKARATERALEIEIAKKLFEIGRETAAIVDEDAA